MAPPEGVLFAEDEGARKMVIAERLLDDARAWIRGQRSEGGGGGGGT
jgi:hypothetical protein